MTQENYANFARQQNASETQVAGRYAIQVLPEKRIVADLLHKLAIEPEDTLLEIGCGPGSLALPLSYLVTETSVVDHQDVLARLKSRGGAKDIRLYPGDFADVTINQQFSKILLYSVLHYLPDFDSIAKFVRKAFDLLLPEGRMVLGDLPNEDKKRRFLASAKGKTFIEEWNLAVAGSDQDFHAKHTISTPNTFGFHDKAVFQLAELVRSWGAETYVLPQPPNLPFGHTREDLVIIKR